MLAAIGWILRNSAVEAQSTAEAQAIIAVQAKIESQGERDNTQNAIATATRALATAEIALTQAITANQTSQAAITQAVAAKSTADAESTKAIAAATLVLVAKVEAEVAQRKAQESEATARAQATNAIAARSTAEANLAGQLPYIATILNQIDHQPQKALLLAAQTALSHTEMITAENKLRDILARTWDSKNTQNTQAKCYR